MQTAAEIVSYIQPIKHERDVAAWVDTQATTVVRRVVASRSDALKALADVRAIARALGADCGIKTVVNKPWGMPATRLPARVKCLAGSCIVRAQ